MAESEVIPPPNDQGGNEPPMGGDTALDKVTELLNGKRETPPPTDDKQPNFDELLTGEGENQPPAKTQLEALAESADKSIDDLYKTEVPMPNREPMTLGELKDAAAKYLDQEQWETQRQEAENNILK